MDDLADFWVHTVTVVPFTGEGPYGAVHGPGVTVVGWCEDTVRVVRRPDGVEATSSTTLRAPAGTSIPARSLVTLPSGRVAEVLTVAVHDSAALGLPDHVEVALT